MHKILPLIISELKLPWLFLLSLVLFVVNLFVPDPVPFLDEAVMALVTALLASLKKKKEDEKSALKSKPKSRLE